MLKKIYYRIKNPRTDVEDVIEKYYYAILILAALIYIFILIFIAISFAPYILHIIIGGLIWLASGIIVIGLEVFNNDVFNLMCILPIVVPFFIIAFIIVIILEFVIPQKYTPKEFFYDKKFDDYN